MHYLLSKLHAYASTCPKLPDDAVIIFFLRHIRGNVIHRAKFEIAGVPTILFLDPEGKEVKENRTAGFIPAKEFLALLNSPKLKSS